MRPVKPERCKAHEREGHRLLSKHEGDGYGWWEYEVSVRDKPDVVETVTATIHAGYGSTGEVTERRGKKRQQKFVCVNGPLVGMKRTAEDARARGYVLYNRAHVYRENGEQAPLCVLVLP